MYMKNRDRKTANTKQHTLDLILHQQMEIKWEREKAENERLLPYYHILYKSQYSQPKPTGTGRNGLHFLNQSKWRNYE